MLSRIVKVVELLGVNTVPLLGVFAGHWSSATALSIYWFENLIASVLIAARLWLYRRWMADAPAGTPAARAKKPSEFLVIALVFTAAHGAMLALIFAIVTKGGPNLANLQEAVVALLALQGLAFGVDLWTLGQWPAARVNERADHLLGRVVLVHLSIIAGMFLMAALGRPAAFFAFFAGAKGLSDLAQFLPRMAVAPGSPPPTWLSAIMRRVPTKDGRTFEQHWAQSRSPLPPGEDPRPPRGRRGR